MATRKIELGIWMARDGNILHILDRQNGGKVDWYSVRMAGVASPNWVGGTLLRPYLEYKIGG